MVRFEDYVSQEMIDQLRKKQEDEDNAKLASNNVPGRSFLERIKDAVNTLTTPAEYDELDTSGYLPNQQMAGQGLAKTVGAIGQLMPENKTRYWKNPITGEVVEAPQIDPTAIGGMKFVKGVSGVTKAAQMAKAEREYAKKIADKTKSAKKAKDVTEPIIEKTSELGSIGDTLTAKQKSAMKNIATGVEAKKGLTVEQLNELLENPKRATEIKQSIGDVGASYTPEQIPDFELIGSPKTLSTQVDPAAERLKLALNKQQGTPIGTPYTPKSKFEASVERLEPSMKMSSETPNISDKLNALETPKTSMTNVDDLPNLPSQAQKNLTNAYKDVAKKAGLMGLGVAGINSLSNSPQSPVTNSEQKLPETTESSNFVESQLSTGDTEDTNKTQPELSSAVNAFSEALGIDAKRAESIVEQLKKAQEQAKQDKAQSRLMMAANEVLRGALGTSYKVQMPEVSNKFWEDRMKDADQGVKDIATLHEAEKEDPDSPISKRMREIMGPVFEKLNIKTPEKMSYSMLKENFPQLVKMYDSQIDTEKSSKEALTSGQKELDKQFAKTFNEYTSGGRASFRKNLKTLEEVNAKLSSKENLGTFASGNIVGRLAPILRTEESRSLEKKAQNAAIESLKSILGGNFTEKDRETIMSMQYDPTLSPEANKEQIQRSINYLKERAEDIERQGKYFREKGTLTGYTETSPEDQQAIEWAKKNPNDPRSKQILELHGI